MTLLKAKLLLIKKSDVFAGLIIGWATGWLALIIFANIEVKLPLVWPLPFILPILSVVGLWFAYFLGNKFAVLWQAAKFALVGVLNTLIDLGLLNILMLFFGITSGYWFAVFKAITFTAATVNSYFWNKYWTFEKTGQVKIGEFMQFFVVGGIGLGINVGVAFFMVDVIGAQFGLSEQIWANVGAFVAVFAGVIWNFLGYKLIVFRR